MAFTAPRTWVSGEVPTAALLNAQIRDNNNELALHAHTGGSGSGSSALGGTIGLTYIDFKDAAAPTGAGGTITRLYSSGSQVGRVEPGGTAAIFSTAGHEHTLAAVGISSSANPGVVTSALRTPYYIGTFGSGSGYLGTVSQARTIGGSGERAVVVCGAYAVMNCSTAASGTFTVNIDRDGTNVGSAALTIGTSASTGSGTSGMVTCTVVETGLASGSATWNASIKSGLVGDGYFYSRALVVQEIKES